MTDKVNDVSAEQITLTGVPMEDHDRNDCEFCDPEPSQLSSQDKVQ